MFTMMIESKEFKVASLADASELIRWHIQSIDLGASDIGPVWLSQGKTRYQVSFNGRIWAQDADAEASAYRMKKQKGGYIAQIWPKRNN